jgi:predicted ATPase/class 3 adenylate cyclase
MTSRRAHPRPELPVGTVTFLRTDIEGSMALVRGLGSRWDAVNATHLDLLRSAVAAHGGVVVRTEGDALFAAFADAGAAAAAAVAAQRALAAHPWPTGVAVRVRIGLHSGTAHLAVDDYGGLAVSTAARVAAAGHGGQVVVTEPTRALLAGALDEGVTIRDLGLHALKDVPHPERLYQLVVPELRTDFPPLRVKAASVPGNLPARLTSFRGHHEALDELRALLSESRLVTLTGPGGIGKTSLATEVARGEAAGYPDGAWFVALDPITDPAAVPGAVARTLGLYDGPERPAADGLSSHVAQRSMLLVLDNFEHVLPAAGVVAGLLQSSAGSRVLVTSRAALRLTGEQEYPVRPLIAAGAEQDGPATELFVDRARAVRPGWAPGADAAAVRDICQLVDGLPLGIELAAARVSALPVRVIRDRLAAHLALPGAEPRDLPARQRTLDATVEWSRALLSPYHQHLLGDLAVFDGGFDVEQVHAVHDPGATGDEPDVLDGIVTLVEHSLVVGDQHAAGTDEPEGVRFRLLRTVADHALKRVAAEAREADLRTRHAAAFLALATAAAAHIPGRDQARWLRRLALDHPNLSAAMDWAVRSGQTGTALDLGAALWRYWQLDGHLAEGRALLERALRVPGAQEPTRSRLGALDAVGGLAYWQDDKPAARHWYREQLLVARALGDRRAEADALLNISYVYVLHSPFGDYTPWRDPATPDRPVTDPFEMIDLLERAYAELGDELGVARIRLGRAQLAAAGGDTATGVPAIEELLESFDRHGDVAYHAMACSTLAWLAFRDGDLPVASRWMLRSVLDSYEVGDRSTATLGLYTAAILAAETGQPIEAATLANTFQALCEQHGVRPPAALTDLLGVADPLESTRASLAEEAFAAAAERGRHMSLDEAVRLLTEVCHRVTGATS